MRPVLQNTLSALRAGFAACLIEPRIYTALMRILPLMLGLLLASALCCVAQVTVEIVTDQAQFLRDESLPVKVRITNRSGQTLRLGTDNQWVAFAIESLDGAIVSKLADAPVAGEFALESGQVATRQVDLTPCFDLSQSGRYTVMATVRIKEWNGEVTSKAKLFEIIRGTKIWEQEFGLPVAAGAPEMRKFTLQQANDQKVLKLYVRLTDPDENRVFKVFPLGPLVSFSHPEAQLDKAGYLHVIFQTGARSFLFFVIHPGGEVILRQTYDYAATRPTLRSNDEGRIFVTGGTRRLTTGDIPTSLTSAVPVTPDGSASATNAPAEAPSNKDAKSRKK